MEVGEVNPSQWGVCVQINKGPSNYFLSYYRTVIQFAQLSGDTLNVVVSGGE